MILSIKMKTFYSNQTACARIKRREIFRKKVEEMKGRAWTCHVNLARTELDIEADNSSTSEGRKLRIGTAAGFST